MSTLQYIKIVALALILIVMPVNADKDVSLRDKQFLFLQDVSLLIIFCVENDIVVTGGELHRTPYQQKEYLRTGKSQTMNSDHLRKLAIDLNFFFNGKLSYSKEEIGPVAVYWKSLRPENYWGGDFKSLADTPHFGTK